VRLRDLSKVQIRGHVQEAIGCGLAEAGESLVGMAIRSRMTHEMPAQARRERLALGRLGPEKVGFGV